MAEARLAARASAKSAACVLAAAAVLTLGLAGCGRAQLPCAGQCGPPFQLQVVFRHGTSTSAGQAVMRTCAAGSRQVERIGPVQLTPLFTGGKRQPHATVYTRSMGSGAATHRLVACLNKAPAVIGAGYPD